MLTLVLVAAGVAAAVQWGHAAKSPPARDAEMRSAEIRYFRDHYSTHDYGCSTDVLISVQGGTPSAEEIQQMKEDSEAQMCTDEIAGDPQRVLLSPPGRQDSEAKKINAAVNRVLCPANNPCLELNPDNPNPPRQLTDADVAAVRQALNDIGHPEAEVRPVQPGDGGPRETVMYGIPLGHRACAVSYATTTRPPGQLGAVGVLASGHCLR